MQDFLGSSNGQFSVGINMPACLQVENGQAGQARWQIHRVVGVHSGPRLNPLFDQSRAMRSFEKPPKSMKYLSAVRLLNKRSDMKGSQSTRKR